MPQLPMSMAPGRVPWVQRSCRKCRGKSHQGFGDDMGSQGSRADKGSQRLRVDKGNQGFGADKGNQRSRNDEANQGSRTHKANQGLSADKTQIQAMHHVLNLTGADRLAQEVPTGWRRKCRRQAQEVCRQAGAGRADGRAQEVPKGGRGTCKQGAPC
eukprot:364869-Chlamydomonas_euryale.AAC.13